MILELPDGATVETLTPVGDGLPCVLRGSIPAGGIVPLHCHADPETFIMIGGEMESYLRDEWSRIVAGEILHVPGHAHHAWRNVSRAAAEMWLVTTGKMARFFRDVAGRSPDEFLELSERYGYWNATPEENAAIGLTVPAPARP
jgi:mannose-6-phosphate isomerase-like protein (cupin superfamily)